MKYKYAIELAYDGTNYHGWQVQPNAITVQEVLEKAFSLILGESLTVLGCGRTDAGVHAKYFVAHIMPSKPIEDCSKLVFKLNSYLPSAIVLFHIEAVPEDFHARFSATSRAYEYHVHTRKSPFDHQYSYLLNYAPDFDLMNAAAQKLLDYSDFTSFSKSNSDVRTYICDVQEAYWEQLDDYHWVFNIKANRFLRNMVRAIVGTLLEVGRGKKSIADFCHIIEAKDRTQAGVSAAGKALFLSDVTYPEAYHIKR